MSWCRYFPIFHTSPTTRRTNSMLHDVLLQTYLFLSYDAKSGQLGISELPAFFVSVCVLPKRLFYIMPPMPPAGIAGAAWGSLMVATADSVVSRVLATLVAFSSAVLVTFAGSRMPSLTMST